MNVLHETTTSGTVDTTDMRGTDITTRVVPAGGHLLLDLLLTEDLTTEVMDDGLKRQCWWWRWWSCRGFVFLTNISGFFLVFILHSLTLPTPTINHILYDLNISPFQQFSGGKVIPWKLETLMNTWNSENCQNVLRMMWKAFAHLLKMINQ